MNNLTREETRQVNLLTKWRDVDLGDVLNEIIDHANRLSLDTTAPVNAVAATKTLTLTGVVVDGETVTINNPARAGTDVYEFLADVAQTKTASTNIAVNINANATKASGSLTLPTQPTSGDTMTIGSKTYTFVPNGTANAEGEVSIGTDLATAQAAIVAAINGTDAHNTANSTVSASAFAVNVCTLTALVGGAGGNEIVTTETFTAVGNVFGAGTLGSGVSCTAANAITALVAAITANDTQGVGAEDGAGDTVVLTADVAGVVGNAIVIGETLTNGAFTAGATALSGGVDGTVGYRHELRSDATYLYVCTATNDTSDANWRRIALGDVY